MRFERQVVFWLCALAVFIGLLWALGGVLLPFAAALALGYVLDPVADRMERLGIPRLGGVVIILAVFLILLALVLFFLVPVLMHQVQALIVNFPGYVTKLEKLASEQGASLFDRYGANLLEKFGVQGGVQASDLQKPVGDLAGQAVSWAGNLVKGLWTGGQAIVSLFSLLVVTPIVAFYMLLDWDSMVKTIDGWVPLEHRVTVRRLAGEMDAAMAGFLRGQSLVCLALGLWYGLGLSLVGLNFGLLIGLSAGLLSFVPYVGSLTALVVASLVAVVQGWPDYSLLGFSVGVVVIGQFLEGNFLSPWLVGGSVGLHPVWLMFALLAAGSLFGFTGLILAVPLAAAAKVLLRFALQRYLASSLYQGKIKSGNEAITLITDSRHPGGL